ncbi:hypothetical protein Tco_0279401, partial [Tanacetum coccineum]
IDEVMIAAGDLHLLQDGPADDSEEESPADVSNVVDGYMVDNGGRPPMAICLAIS